MYIISRPSCRLGRSRRYISSSCDWYGVTDNIITCSRISIWSSYNGPLSPPLPRETPAQIEAWVARQSVHETFVSCSKHHIHDTPYSANKCMRTALTCGLPLALTYRPCAFRGVFFADHMCCATLVVRKPWPCDGQAPTTTIVSLNSMIMYGRHWSSQCPYYGWFMRDRLIK